MPEITWELFDKQVAECRLCPLCQHILNKVPGQGDRQSPLMFIGEGPGQTEDEEGLEVRTCKNDPSHKEERSIAKLPHTHNLTKTEAKDCEMPPAAQPGADAGGGGGLPDPPADADLAGPAEGDCAAGQHRREERAGSGNPDYPGKG